MSVVSPVTAWSYSRLSTYETCPLQFKLRNIDKIPQDQSAAAARGDRIHKGVAAYITGAPLVERGVSYTQELMFDAKAIDKFKGVLTEIKSNMPLVEQQWGFTKDMKPTSWFGADTWYRSILDVGVLWPDNAFTVVDWKTGKPYGTNAEQMEQFACAVFARYKQTHTVETRLMYLDTGQEQHEEFSRKDYPALWTKWEKRAAPMFADRTFAARPGQHCRWCSFSATKGGQCRFG